MTRIAAGLFAVAALSALSAVAAFAQVGPFAVTTTPVAGSAALTSTSPGVVAATPFVRLTGSGTISFGLPDRYGTGMTITDYLCQNTFLTPSNPNGASSGPDEPAMGVRGQLNGHTYQALFSATRTSVIFENISLTPAMSGGAAATYVQGQHVAGTVAIQTGPDTVGTARQGSGTVTVDLTCAGGAAAVSAAPAGSAAAAPVAAAPPVGAPPVERGTAVLLAITALATGGLGLLSLRRPAPAPTAAAGPVPGDPTAASSRGRQEYADDDPDREAKMRLDDLIAAEKRLRDDMKDTGETRGGDNSVSGGGCLNIFGNLYEALFKHEDRLDGFDHHQAEVDRLVSERARYDEAAAARESARANDDPTDRQPLG